MARWLTVVLTLFVSTVYCNTAEAEWDAALYGGVASTEKFNTTQTSPGLSVTGDVSTNTGPIVGGRAGYWFDEKPLYGLQYGLGLDVFYFTANTDTQTTSVTVNGMSGFTATSGSTENRAVGLGFDVLRLRLPLLKDEQFRNGRLQPYLTAGPAVFFSRSKSTDAVNGFNPPNQSQSDTSLGVKVGVGANYQVTPSFGLLAEYRFTHFSANYTGFSDVGGLGSPVGVQTDVNTHFFIVGASFDIK